MLRETRADKLEMMLAGRTQPSVRGNMYTQHEIRLSEHLARWMQVQTLFD